MGISLHGRRKIFTSKELITADNVIAEVNEALAVHMQNVTEMDYLYWYRRGVTPVLTRSKEIRPEINNKVETNLADSITAFKNGYFLTKPATYVSRREDEETTNKVRQLNEFLYNSGKHHADNAVVNDFHTMGIGALYVEPNKEDDDPNKPVNVYQLDPRSAFVVYSRRPGNRPVYAVNMVIDGNDILFDVITRTNVYRLKGSYVTDTKRKITNHGLASVLEGVEPNIVGEIPIIEYTYNENRMSCFEIAISMMDALDTVESNRVDGIEQFIQSLLLAINCEFEEGTTAAEIRQAGMISLKSVGENKADFKILSEQLDQTQTQTTVQNYLEQIHDRCGVPMSSNTDRSTSDNAGAVYFRNGWAMADTHARDTEDLFKAANKLFDKVFLKIVEAKSKLRIYPSDFDLCFYRNDSNNIQSKVQAALGMKNFGLAPEICLERSGLSNDPTSDLERSKEYIKKEWAKSEPSTVGPVEHNTEYSENGTQPEGEQL